MKRQIHQGQELEPGSGQTNFSNSSAFSKLLLIPSAYQAMENQTFRLGGGPGIVGVTGKETNDSG